MPTKNPGRIEEAEINRVVLAILAAHPTGRATVQYIRGELPNHVRLSADDHADSPTREHEELWEQQVRNLKSHSTVPGNVFCEGYVICVRRGVWEITDAGRAHVNGR